MGQTELTAPMSGPVEGEWRVVAKTARVNKSWEGIIARSPENAVRCYEHLKGTPLKRQQGRVFPLKGKKYRGCWEYEVTSGDRVFYTVDKGAKVVTVYYADKHPNPPAPTP